MYISFVCGVLTLLVVKQEGHPTHKSSCFKAHCMTIKREPANPGFHGVWPLNVMCGVCVCACAVLLMSTDSLIVCYLILFTAEALLGFCCTAELFRPVSTVLASIIEVHWGRLIC